MGLIFVVIYMYYSQFRQYVNIRRSKNLFKQNFQVVNFRSFFQPQIIYSGENFHNYSSF